jgi:hypothetical protein
MIKSIISSLKSNIDFKFKRDFIVVNRTFNNYLAFYKWSLTTCITIV